MYLPGMHPVIKCQRWDRWKLLCPDFVTTAENDYFPIRGYFGPGLQAPHGQNFPQCPARIDPHIKVSSS